MENWRKLSFNYHQIPALSVPLMSGMQVSHLSRDMTKPTKWLCAQRRLRSAWASAQSDQSLRCALNGWLRTQAFFIRTAKTLIRLVGCPGWSEFSLDAQSLCWFCHVAAHFCCCYFTDGISSPPASTSWLFKKPSDNHDKFLDANSCMNLFELSDQVSKWARKTTKRWISRKDTHQPAQLHSLIRVFTDLMKFLLLVYP